MSELAISNEQLIKNLDEIALRVEKWPEWKKEAWVVLGLGESALSIHCNKVNEMSHSIDPSSSSNEGN